MSRESELKEEWDVEAKENVGTRTVYFFGNKVYGSDRIQVKITVSRTFADSEREAWKLLGEIVK